MNVFKKPFSMLSSLQNFISDDELGFIQERLISKNY